MSHLFVKDILWQFEKDAGKTLQKSPDFLKWIGGNLVNFTDTFVQNHKLTESHFIIEMNTAFKTSRFEALTKKWVMGYLFRLFELLDDYLLSPAFVNREIILDDIPLNRFAVEKYYIQFSRLPNLRWKSRPHIFKKILSMVKQDIVILYLSLNRGLKLRRRIKEYKIMREALWGLCDTGGRYFHDDFMVDGKTIKKEDLLLFSRRIAYCKSRYKAYEDAKKSGYANFDLTALPISFHAMVLRIVPKYIFKGNRAIFMEISSAHFLVWWSIYAGFIYNAVPYEKVFSTFKIISELGHNYFSINHIAEAIVCQNYGVKYYLMHWSDFTLPIIHFQLAFLACDGIFLWGPGHKPFFENGSEVFISIGYVFKRHIKVSRIERHKLLLDMGIGVDAGKIISFFDETFGRGSEMTEEHYVVFWETILEVARRQKNHTVIIKPKGSPKDCRLSLRFKDRFHSALNEISAMKNVFFVDSYRWTFIETIAVSDIVVTQGMTSSGTIAIICGIEGLYLDQFGYEHRLSRDFKDKIVFDDPGKFITMIDEIIAGREYPLRSIPNSILRDLDAYDDDCGVDRLRFFLTGKS